MKITVLCASNAAVKGIKTDRGQSFFIRAGDHNLQYGFGSGKTYLENMGKLHIYSDLVDTAFLPSGSKNDGGGIMTFLKDNRRADIYVRPAALQPHYVRAGLGKKDVSLDKKLQLKHRLIRAKNYCVAKDGSYAVFSVSVSDSVKIAQREDFLMKDGTGAIVPDDFSHELYLLVRAGGRWALFCGDTHAGIGNVLRIAQELVRRNLGGRVAWVIGSFGLADAKGKRLPDADIDAVAKDLDALDGVAFYTGHSTDEYSLARMQRVLGDRIRLYGAGSEIEIGQ